MKSKLFWTWMAIEVGAMFWFGWQVAKADPKPWARKKKRKNPKAVF